MKGFPFQGLQLLPTTYTKQLLSVCGVGLLWVLLLLLLLLLSLQPANTPAWQFFILMYRGSGKKISFLGPRLLPTPRVSDSQAHQVPPQAPAPQTWPAGATPWPSVVLSLFSCSIVFENI